METATNGLIVDASVAVKWALRDEEYVQESAIVLQHFMTGAVELLAPSHIRYEVPSAITVATGGSTPRLTKQAGQEAIQDFLALGIPTVDTDGLILSAFPLVAHYNIAFYDALYLALSRQRSFPLITADNRLYQRINNLPNVIWVSNYQALPSDET